jgi:hypothetical protein
LPWPPEWHFSRPRYHQPFPGGLHLPPAQVTSQQVPPYCTVAGHLPPSSLDAANTSSFFSFCCCCCCCRLAPPSCLPCPKPHATHLLTILLLVAAPLIT